MGVCQKYKNCPYSGVRKGRNKFLALKPIYIVSTLYVILWTPNNTEDRPISKNT